MHHHAHAPTPKPHPRQVLEVMWDEDVALCLTPQAFDNLHQGGDIFNNINVQVRCVSEGGHALKAAW
jgi:hypothetical protein